MSRADRVVVARAVRFVLLGFGADDAVVAEAVSPTSAVATATGPTIMKDPKSIAAPAHAQRCSIALPHLVVDGLVPELMAARHASFRRQDSNLNYLNQNQRCCQLHHGGWSAPRL